MFVINTQKSYFIRTLLKRVTDIYLKTIISQDESLSPEELEFLISIAEKCPEEAGSAVYKAQFLIPECLRTPSTWCQPPNQENKSPLITERHQMNNKPNSSISSTKALIYPNPTSSSFTINAPNFLHSIHIVNLNGQSIYQRNYVDSVKKQVLNPELSNGIYFIKVVLKDGTQTNEKLIIQN